MPDTAIGANGRTVRCAKCHHSWHQQGPTAPPPPAAAEARPPLAQSAPTTPVVASSAPADEADSPPQAMRMPRKSLATEPSEAVSAYDHRPPFRRRRNPAFWRTAAAMGFALIAIGAIGAVSRFGLPAWLPLASQAGFGAAQPGLTVDFPPNRQNRRTLPNGTQYFGVSGTITNIGHERRAVPQVLILLRDGHDHVVYRWSITPPERVLAPGESEAVIEATTAVPRSAKYAEIGWKYA